MGHMFSHLKNHHGPHMPKLDIESICTSVCTSRNKSNSEKSLIYSDFILFPFQFLHLISSNFLANSLFEHLISLNSHFYENLFL